KGMLGFTSSQQVLQQQADFNARIQPVYERFREMPIQDIAQDAQALDIGQRLFLNNCAQCHGSDARGSRGFPNLTDGDWLYGGAPEQIQASIAQGRSGLMPPQAATLGTAEDVKDVAASALSLSGRTHDGLR